MTQLKRNILVGEPRDRAVSALQSTLFDLAHLELQAKHARWNVVGPQFRSARTMLKEVSISLGEAADGVAERLQTLGASPDARVHSVIQNSTLIEFPAGTQTAHVVVGIFADRLFETSQTFRSAFDILNEVDPASGRVLLDSIARVETQLQEFQAFEGVQNLAPKISGLASRASRGQLWGRPLTRRSAGGDGGGASD